MWILQGAGRRLAKWMSSITALPGQRLKRREWKEMDGRPLTASSDTTTAILSWFAETTSGDRNAVSSRCAIISEAGIHKSVTHFFFYQQTFFQMVVSIFISADGWQNIMWKCESFSDICSHCTRIFCNAIYSCAFSIVLSCWWYNHRKCWYLTWMIMCYCSAQLAFHA